MLTNIASNYTEQKTADGSDRTRSDAIVAARNTPPSAVEIKILTVVASHWRRMFGMAPIMQDDRHFTFRSLEPLIIDLVLNDIGGDRVDLARVHARFLADKLDATPAPMVLSRLKLLAYYWGFDISMDAVAALEADIFCELYRVVCSASGSRQDRARAVQAIVRTHQQLTLNETRAAA